MNIKHIKIATGSPQATGQVDIIEFRPALGKLYEKNWHQTNL